ncbi:MAG TPA: AraC family transcriptional regulator [Tepidisphaeraceae bacterium]|nr:AraC family transcriptional regulator [Tepidisphaeraceae bacterium]
MQVIRDPSLTSGFVYENPLPDLDAVTHCGEAVTTARHAIPTHRHTGFEFMYVCRGAYTWASGQREYAQGVSDLFVAFPGDPHRTADRPHPPCHQLWLGVRLDRLGDDGAALASRLTRERRHVVQRCPEVEPILRGIVQQAVRPGAGRAAVAAAYLTVLVRVIAQRLADGDAAGAGPERPGVRYSYPVLKALHLMAAHLDRRLTLAELAHATGGGTSQLCKLFREEVGQSPAEHHLWLRLNAAKERLLAADASILDAALDCGFSSPQHLSTHFRRAFGLTPRQWMRQPRAGDRRR